MKATFLYLVVVSLLSTAVYFRRENNKTTATGYVAIKELPHIYTTQELIEKTPLYKDLEKVETLTTATEYLIDEKKREQNK